MRDPEDPFASDAMPPAGHRSLRLRRWGLAVAAVALLAAAVAGVTNRASVVASSVHAGPGIVPFPNVGSTARDFTLPVLRLDEPFTGPDSVTLSDLRGRYVYLDVFGSWCGPCQQKYPAMRDVARAVERQGGMILGLLLEDRPPDAAAWFRDNGGLSYPFLVLDDETTRAWRMAGAPMGFLISPEGRIIRKCAGCAMEGHLVEDLPREIRRLAR
jgi:thiol-disulfide isomerase/thioredoxin